MFFSFQGSSDGCSLASFSANLKCFPSENHRSMIPETSMACPQKPNFIFQFQFPRHIYVYEHVITLFQSLQRTVGGCGIGVLCCYKFTCIIYWLDPWPESISWFPVHCLKGSHIVPCLVWSEHFECFCVSWWELHSIIFVGLNAIQSNIISPGKTL